MKENALIRLYALKGHTWIEYDKKFYEQLESEIRNKIICHKAGISDLNPLEIFALHILENHGVNFYEVKE